MITKTQLKLNNAQQGSSAQEVPRLEINNHARLVITVMLEAKLSELIVNFVI